MSSRPARDTALRGRAVRLVLAAPVVLALAACEEAPATAVASEGPTATAACGAVQTFPVQGEGHLVGNQEPPVPYNSTPPTSGWHASRDVPIVVTDEAQPLSEPEQVTVLELGGVVVAHGDLPDADRAALERLVTENYQGQAALTAYDRLDAGEVALTAWTVLQRCDAVDVGAVEGFVEFYAQR